METLKKIENHLQRVRARRLITFILLMGISGGSVGYSYLIDTVKYEGSGASYFFIDSQTGTTFNQSHSFNWHLLRNGDSSLKPQCDEEVELDFATGRRVTPCEFLTKKLPGSGLRQHLTQFAENLGNKVVRNFLNKGPILTDHH